MLFLCLELLYATGKPASQKKLPNRNKWHFEAQISQLPLSYADFKIVSRIILQKAALISGGRSHWFRGQRITWGALATHRPGVSAAPF